MSCLAAAVCVLFELVSASRNHFTLRHIYGGEQRKPITMMKKGRGKRTKRKKKM